MHGAGDSLIQKNNISIYWFFIIKYFDYGM